MALSVPPSPEQTRELEVLIEAHHPLLMTETVEHERLGELFEHVAERLGLPLFEWGPTTGLVRRRPDKGRPLGTETFEGCLGFLESADLEAIFHVHGLAPDVLQEPAIIARLRSIYRRYFRHRGLVAVSAPSVPLPPELEPLFTPLPLEPPSVAAYHQYVSEIVRDIAKRRAVSVDMTSEDVDELLHALHGLTLFEVQKIITRAVIVDGRLCRDDIARVVEAKRHIIERSGVLEYFPHSEQMGNVAGLATLKAWLRKRREAFTDPTRARAFGLSPPKGLMLIGVQGCGKSLCAKAIASAWKMPLVRLDPSNLYDKLFGESEKNLRRALRTAEQMAPVALWIDEIKKAFGRGDNDSGTSQRIFGTFLTWLQDKKENVFVIATANEIDQLPPELLRKGRFDEIFFVDLPSEAIRADILGVHLRRRKRDPAAFDVERLATASHGFSGAELEQAIVSALYTAFSNDEELSTAAIEAELRATRPLSVTMAERIEALRSWARERAVLAD